ncbi:MAG: hypothetical protein Q7R54_03240 [bacterium]|nr:hypothetical protein [bacterium]
MNDEPKKQEPFEIPPDEAAKHYIRTLESDSAAVKQGTKPGFAAVEEAAPPATPPASPPRASLEPIDIPTETLPSDVFEIGAKEPDEPARVRLIESSPVPPVPIQKKLEPPPAPPPTLPKPVPAIEAPIHTYTSDFAVRLKDTSASTISVLAAEGDVKQKPTRAALGFNIPLIAGGILLMVLGAGGAYATYRYVSTPPAPFSILPGVSAPIFVNEREEIFGTGSTLLEAIEMSVVKPLAEGSIRLLYLSVATSTSNNIFSALQLPAPGILLRNIEAVGSMAGIVRVGGAPSLFFILSASSYSDTFAGMLAWEPRVASDLAALYPPTATSTRVVFKDEIISNHDVRILRDSAGQSLVLYGYWDQRTLIISRNEDAFREILKRLATSRTER